MNCVFTLDHRYGDAALLIQFTKIIKDCMEDPESFNPDSYQQLTPYNESERLETIK